MTEENKPEAPAFDAAAAIEALNAKLDALSESVKPKPAKTDRDLLEEIAAGLGKLGEALKPGESNPEVTPPVKKAAPAKATPAPAEEAPVKKGNPWTRHHQR